MPHGDKLYLLEAIFKDGRTETLPACFDKPDQDLEELAKKYLSISERGIAFPGLVNVKVRMATIAEFQAYVKDRAAARHQYETLTGQPMLED